MSDNNNNKKLIRWESLPSEIATDIFLRLPIKSIIICTSVSKAWKSLIQNPTFISTHLHHSHNKNKNLLVFSLYSHTHKESYALHNEDDPDFTQLARFDYPFHVPFLQSPNGIYRVVGTCNGLFCLSDDKLTYSNCLCLWNPCVRKLVHLPIPNVTYATHGGFDATIGFGFDPKTNDYKVAFVNGALHWVAFRRADDNNLQHFVLVFDLGNEGCQTGDFYLWVMEEYGVVSSWTKVLKIGEGLPRPIGFKRNGEVVLLSYDGQLVLWVPWSTEFKHLEIIGYEDTFVDCYVESLVLLDRVANDAYLLAESTEKHSHKDIFIEKAAYQPVLLALGD
ncbi:hypothetical protein SO802_032317 [Lithocarpus litseifolius]|uniref:F-box domain-containing protein n=1 Tax=Lithocarpus litseifolius TaxID=425828 RepID=A0AAW2BN33_9ROSI